MNNQVIFAVLDKRMDCDKYLSFHKSEYVSKDILKEYFKDINPENTDPTIILKEDRIIRTKTERIEEILIIVEPIIVK